MLAPDADSRALNGLRYTLASDIVELAVLTGDEPFLATLREAVGAARRLWQVPSGDKVSDLLVAGGVGILVLDVSALLEAPAVFIGQIKRQFPDLVVLVAGPREAETALARLISDGTVYRFIHKPLSPGRARLFADAAVKRYEELGRRGAAGAAVSVERRTRSPRLLLLLIAGTLAAGGGAGLAWLHSRQAPPAPTALLATPALAPSDARAQRAAASADEQARAEGALALELAKVLKPYKGAPAAKNAASPGAVTRAGVTGNATGMPATAAPEPTANAVAASAAAAPASDGAPSGSMSATPDARRAGELAALAVARADEGRLLEPAADDARDYLLAALKADARDPAVLDAQESVALKLLAAARAALGGHELDEAARLIEAADGIASPANVENLREQLASALHPKTSDRARELLDLAQERLQQDRLLEPNNDSARYYLGALRTLDPGYAGLAAAAQDFDARLVTRARGALAQRQYEEARSLLKEATADGYSSADAVTALRELEAATTAQPKVVSASALVLVRSVQPDYPRRAQQQASQGWVDFEFTVNERGEVKDIVVRGSQPAGVFEQAARSALAQWRYRPVLRDGVPIEQRARVRIRFALDH